MNPTRYIEVNKKSSKPGPILYWMSREQRVSDNWAVIKSAIEAEKNNEELHVLFVLLKSIPNGNLRNYHFMIEGLKEVENDCKSLGIKFSVEIGNPIDVIDKYIKKNKVGKLITDFSPLKHAKRKRKEIVKKANIHSFIVDSRNIVPVWHASDEQEYAARTIRKKINSKLDEFLEEFPKIENYKFKRVSADKNTDWKSLWNKLNIDNSVQPSEIYLPGRKNAEITLKRFIDNKLDEYSEKRNDPNQKVLSNLSPYIHYGQISAQRIALEIKRSNYSDKDKETYLEELIVRRELAENYCYYDEDYDNFNGFPSWAKESLNKHKNDKREFIYTLEQLENSETHDDLWNASQNEMVKTGKMHGYMRMYWAKKILEWTSTPDDAIEIAILLNDKYELDGRETNGYTGIAWSIGGVHDQGWKERKIFGKIRYMNDKGASRKFDTEKYINEWLD